MQIGSRPDAKEMSKIRIVFPGRLLYNNFIGKVDS